MPNPQSTSTSFASGWMPWSASAGLGAVILCADWVSYEAGWRHRVVFQFGWLDQAVYAPLIVFVFLLVLRLILRARPLATLAAILLELPLFVILWGLAIIFYTFSSGLGYI